jgi:sirohydrochlorin ferrochelatase
MYCTWEAHDFTDDDAMRKDLLVVHVAHLLAADPSLEELASLPENMGADRVAMGEPWTYYKDEDD